MYKHALDAKIYVEPNGLSAVPTWQEITDAENVTLSMTKQEASINNRASKNEKLLSGNKVREISFTITYDPADAQYETLRDAFENDTLIAIAAMDGNIATSGSEGLQMDVEVVQFNRQEPQNGPITVDVTVKPSARGTFAEPAYVEVA